MTIVVIRPEAEDEMASAAVWYESERLGLGERFLDAVEGVFRRIEERPRQFPMVGAEEGIRRALVGRFPFGVFFVEEPEACVVLAVLHLHRHPDIWRRRR